MIRNLLVGLWACTVTLAATLGGAYWREQPKASGSNEHKPKVQVEQIAPITVPIIDRGVVTGYVSAEFSIIATKGEAHGGSPLEPESFFMDEAFRLIYSDNKTDFSNIQKVDLDALTAKITANVNKRMGRPAVQETLMRSFNFVPREEIMR